MSWPVVARSSRVRSTDSAEVRSRTSSDGPSWATCATFVPSERSYSSAASRMPAGFPTSVPTTAYRAPVPLATSSDVRRSGDVASPTRSRHRAMTVRESMVR